MAGFLCYSYEKFGVLYHGLTVFQILKYEKENRIID